MMQYFAGQAALRDTMLRRAGSPLWASDRYDRTLAENAEVPFNLRFFLFLFDENTDILFVSETHICVKSFLW